jgi:hypothetical protein
MGGRSFSIWNATTGALVFDSKDIIEQITSTHPQFAAIFNASNSTGAPALKNRSDDKGPEPEGVSVQQFDGNTYAFVSLERIGGVMIFKINDPANPVYVGYQNNRSTTLSGPDLGAEGIITIPAADSPNGNDLVILANEVSSTLSIYQMQTCAQASGAVIASSDNTICPGQSTNLTINGSVSSTYQWYNNNQPIPSSNLTAINVNTPGTYKVAVTNSTLGCSDESVDYIVTLNPTPNVNAGNDQTVCAGTQVSFSATGANSFLWNNGVNNALLTVNTVNSNYSNTYTVTGTDATTGCTANDQVTITVNALPNLNAGNDLIACDNSPITLTATGANSYTWTGGITNGIPLQLNSGTFNFSVTGTDVNGCAATDSINVTINPSPVVSAGNDQIVCSNELPATITATSDQLQTGFLWNGSQSGAQINASTSGNYIVLGTNIFGCSSSDTITLDVFPVLTVEAGTIVSVCSSDLPATLSAAASSQIQTYQWSTGENTQNIEVNQNGIFEVTVTDANGCQAYDEVEVTVLSSPSVNAGLDQVVCENEFPVTLGASGSGGSVEWSNGSQSPLTTVNNAGIYTVTVTSTNGCTANDSVEVILESCASTEELSNLIAVYPNPTKDEVVIQSSVLMNGSVKVFSTDGKLILSELVYGKNSYSIHLLDYPSGIYHLRMDLDTVTKDIKIIKH